MKKKGKFYRAYTIEKSLKHHVIEWAAMAMSVIGAVMNAQLNVWGFYVFMLGNILWISFSMKHRHWGLFVTQVMFFALNVYGIWIWMQHPALT
ncbi:MAG: nicotinamide mononucleotide transporter [Nanoarchaeota archaeon]